MIIYIDAGHGGVWPNGDPGVVSQDGKKIESAYNFHYANKLADYLTDRGFAVSLTRDHDDYKIPYSQRTKDAKPHDLLISIHFDTYLGGKRLIYYSDHAFSKKLAENIDIFFSSKDLRASESSRFNGLYIDDANCPAVLVEVDRIDKASMEPSVVEAFCEDIYLGLQSYIGADIETPDNSGQIEENTFDTPFSRVFFVSPENETTEVPVERMSIVGDKLYIAPAAEFFED